MRTAVPATALCAACLIAAALAPLTARGDAPTLAPARTRAILDHASPDVRKKCEDVQWHVNVLHGMPRDLAKTGIDLGAKEGVVIDGLTAEQSRDLIWTGFQIDSDNDDATRQEIVIASCEIMLDPSINVAIARSYQAEAPKAAQAQNETERKKVAAVAEQADNMAEAKLSAPEAIAHLAARTAPLMHYGSGEAKSCIDGEYIDCSVFGVSDRYVLMDSLLRLASLQLATPHAITSGAMYLDVVWNGIDTTVTAHVGSDSGQLLSLDANGRILFSTLGRATANACSGWFGHFTLTSAQMVAAGLS